MIVDCHHHRDLFAMLPELRLDMEPEQETDLSQDTVA